MNIKDKTAIYFSKTAKIAEKNFSDKIITLQFFQRQDDVKLCGINEVLKLLKKYTDVSRYTIKFLPEGSIVNNKEVVLELIGQYHHFGIYEGMIDGILARQTSIATNAYRILKAANGKTVISMADRADHYRNQIADSYAIEVGGIKNHATLASAKGAHSRAFGSMPHALIQMSGGDIVKACKLYNEMFPEDDLVALVDFHNDVITDSLLVLNEFKDTLKAVRVDTSKNMIDKMFLQDSGEFGVTPNQIKRLRQALDEHGGKHVKIYVSSGFNAEKIQKFEEQNAPVDGYGVGASLLKLFINFSADATKLNNKLIAKEGRGYSENKKLQLKTWKNI
ncbi:nicotinate phosphoribosyltransferase [[Mycoplasma] gypis]|uniref:nicotinate phosphoribosyltransferase n=1 Tax=[Mycoplasma] gypis TaxID=92404 RepID=A0ABZ2RQI9_9BACT|nr:nicotinate phosphoribosyltransferase [[Mycoplasma] gypis]MBN0919515.1 nicotinate phosphoribosyltransferase [[Mycoplasma] gypis]